MYRTHRLALTLILCGAALSAQAAIPCPPMPSAVTQVNRNVNSDVKANVGTWGNLKAGEIGAKTEVEARNLFDKYPNVDRLLTLQTLSATYCGMLNAATGMTDVEKIDRWERFMDKVNALQSGGAAPANAKATVEPAKPRPSPVSKPKPMPVTNLMGSWAGSASCVVVFTKDDGTQVEGSCDTPGHTHKIYGTYQNPSQISVTITRTDPAGCVTNVQGFIKVINPNTVEMGQNGWNGCNVNTESVTTVLTRR